MQKSTKNWLIGGLITATLIGGGIAAYFHFKKGDEDKPKDDKLVDTNTSQEKEVSKLEEKVTTKQEEKPKQEVKPSVSYWKQGDKMYLSVNALNSLSKNNTALYAYSSPIQGATKVFEIAQNNRVVGYYWSAAPNGFIKIKATDNKLYFVKALLSDKSPVYTKTPAF